MKAPVIGVLQRQPDDLVGLLRLRFGREYDVQGHSTCAAVTAAARRAVANGQRVALVLADREVGDGDSMPTLTALREVDADVLRCLLLNPGDRVATDQIAAAVGVGDVDRYFMVPWAEPNVGLYPPVTELLATWWQRIAPESAAALRVRVCAPPLSRRAHELRDLLDRNGVAASFLAPDSADGADLLSAGGAAPTDVVVALADGRILVNPTNGALAEHLGARVRPTDDTADVVVVGGGPAGLAAAVYAASEGLDTVVIERSAIGGQAGTSSHIRNYPGFPHGVSGTELASRASEQAWLFGVEFVLTNAVTTITPEPGGHRIGLADGSELRSRAVVLAIGVEYRQLTVPGVERLTGAGVYYGAARAEAPGFLGRHVFIVGAGNSAGQAAAHLAGYAAEVTLLVRGESLSASMSDYLIRQLDRTPNVSVRLRTEVAAAVGGHRLEALTLREAERQETVPADALFIMIGAVPHTEWLPDSVLRAAPGFVLTGSDVPEGDVGPLPYETAVPGIFAIGDVRHGSVKRVASAVGEGAVCISSVHKHLERLSTGERQAWGT